MSIHLHHVASLKNLQLADLGDYLLEEICARNLDWLTRKLFEQSLGAGVIPTHKNLMDFVTKQATMQELLKSEQQGTFHSASDPSGPKSKALQVRSNTDKNKNVHKCRFCQSEAHKIYSCDSFLKLSVADRLTWVKKSWLCVGCLGNSHKLVDCKSKQYCKNFVTRGNTIHLCMVLSPLPPWPRLWTGPRPPLGLAPREIGTCRTNPSFARRPLWRARQPGVA